MGNQQLKEPRNLKNSHFLTYFSIGIATKANITYAKTKDSNMV
jgi:hypothetical protein